MKVGFIGLGNVGGKLAGSLLRYKFDLTKSRLISESFETSVDGAVVVNLTYKKYSNKR